MGQWPEPWAAWAQPLLHQPLRVKREGIREGSGICRLPHHHVALAISNPEQLTRSRCPWTVTGTQNPSSTAPLRVPSENSPSCSPGFLASGLPPFFITLYQLPQDREMETPGHPSWAEGGDRAQVARLAPWRVDVMNPTTTE